MSYSVILLYIGDYKCFLCRLFCKMIKMFLMRKNLLNSCSSQLQLVTAQHQRPEWECSCAVTLNAAMKIIALCFTVTVQSGSKQAEAVASLQPKNIPQLASASFTDPWSTSGHSFIHSFILLMSNHFLSSPRRYVCSQSPFSWLPIPPFPDSPSCLPTPLSSPLVTRFSGFSHAVLFFHYMLNCQIRTPTNHPNAWHITLSLVVSWIWTVRPRRRVRWSRGGLLSMSSHNDTVDYSHTLNWPSPTACLVNHSLGKYGSSQVKR